VIERCGVSCGSVSPPNGPYSNHQVPARGLLAPTKPFMVTDSYVTGGPTTDVCAKAQPARSEAMATAMSTRSLRRIGLDHNRFRMPLQDGWARGEIFYTLT
jgi:hypothetical protein